MNKSRKLTINTKAIALLIFMVIVIGFGGPFKILDTLTFKVNQSTYKTLIKSGHTVEEANVIVGNVMDSNANPSDYSSSSDKLINIAFVIIFSIITMYIMFITCVNILYTTVPDIFMLVPSISKLIDNYNGLLIDKESVEISPVTTTHVENENQQPIKNNDDTSTGRNKSYYVYGLDHTILDISSTYTSNLKLEY